MHSSAAEIECWVRDRASELCESPRKISAIRVAKRGSISDVDLRFGDESRRIIVKSFPRDTISVGRLLTYHDRLIATNPKIATFTPKFLSGCESNSWVAMEYIPGEPLETLLLRAISTGSAAVAACNVHLESAGRLFAEFTRVSAREIGLEGSLRENRSFLPTLETWVRRYRGQLALAGLNWRRFESFSKQHSPEFLSRVGDRVLPVDSQPKNILVDDGGRMCFIDLAYSMGNPAFGVALFLVGLDRINLRRPFFCKHIFGGWKQAFLDGYLAAATAPEAVRDDVRFFYPWTILYTLDRHRTRRPVWGSLASLFYARRFADSIRELSR